MTRDTFSSNRKMCLSWEVEQKNLSTRLFDSARKTPNNTALFLLTAKSKLRLMEDILFNVDSEGSSLLHLAVESGNSEVTNLFMIILNSPTSERPELNE